MSEHIWDCIEPNYYIFPQLHFEIGVINMVLDNFYGFIEDRVEVLSPEAKVARNSVTIAESSTKVCKNQLEEWLGDTFYTLNELRIQKSNMASALKLRHSHRRSELICWQNEI